MPDRPQAVLRVEPQQLSALRAAFLEAHDTIAHHLEDLRRDGQIKVPWLDDDVSKNVHRLYDTHVMNGPGSTYQHLQMYRDELYRVHEALTEIEAAYRHSDDKGAALLGRWA